MGTVTSVVTVDTNEWEYIDMSGVGHKITNGQTFNLTIDDNSATDVRYYILPGQTMTTTDGGIVTFCAESVTDGLNYQQKSSSFGDTAHNGVVNNNVSWTMPMKFGSTGVVQMWKAGAMKMSDVDFGSAGTIQSVVFTDQFDNVMTLPGTGSGITVAQAA